MSIVLRHNEYLELSDRSKRYRQQRDALAEALREVVYSSQCVMLSEEDGVIQDAQDALKQLEDG